MAAAAILGALTLELALVGCGNGGGGGDGSGDPALSALGERVFEDTNLSEPSGQGCVTCHDPNHAFAAPDGRAVPAGARGGASGFRNAPSLTYALRTPPFSLGEVPTGGFNRDGRAADFAEQARRPFLAAHEMANPDVATLIAKVKQAPYAEEFRALFGPAVLDDPEGAFGRVREALAAYQRTDEFHRFDSKFDHVREGTAQFTDQELLGLQLYQDPTKGNCAACHPTGGPRPLFTDFSYDNLGVPRNPEIPANRDPSYFDLGLCGPFRTDLGDTTLCGAFKVPSLRNVAVTAPYMHNGRFKTLREVVDFYVTRDTNPERWYPRGRKFNDLPPPLIGNVNTSEVPYDRHPGEEPRLNGEEIDAVVAFLNTLTDGFAP